MNIDYVRPGKAVPLGADLDADQHLGNLVQVLGLGALGGLSHML